MLYVCMLMNTHMCVCTLVCVCVCMYVCFHFLLQFINRLGSSNIPLAMSILFAQILASKYHFLLNSSGIFKKNGKSQDWGRKEIAKPGKSNARK